MKIIFTLKRSSLGLNCKRISYVKNSRKLAAVVAQLAEGSIPTTEDLCSNPAISNFSTENVFPLTFGKTKMIEKGQDCPLLITNGTQTRTIGVTDIVLTTEPKRNYSFLDRDCGKWLLSFVRTTMVIIFATNLGNLWCHHSSVDSTAHNVLSPRFRVPNTPTLLYYICHVKRTKMEQKKRPGLAH